MTSCYHRIGDLTMISNRNIDSSKEYVLIEKNSDGVGKIKKSANSQGALEIAIEDATEEYDGEYLMNAKIYVKGNGRRIKVEGDVWGFKSTTIDVVSSVTKTVEFETGDTVTFYLMGKLKEGKLVGINPNGAVVEYNNKLGQQKKKEVEFDDLTKIEK